MPAELLPYAPSYCVVGAYRLCSDSTLWKPIWFRSRRTLFIASLISLPLALLSYPLTSIYVTLVLSRSPFSPSKIHDAALLGVSPARFTTLMLVLGQVSALIEFALKREIARGRKEMYEATVKSRGKGTEFWGPYVEEWKVPPFERAKRYAERQGWFNTLTSPLLKIVVLRVLLAPLDFIPFLGLVVGAALRSLTLARTLHEPYFKAKKMTPTEISLFMVERQTEYRTFGFFASLLERLPFVGLIFTLSNRIGAAMWAHDLEKRQHMFAAGELKPEKVYESKTEKIEPSGLPTEFVGGFPEKKGPVKILLEAGEVKEVM